MFKHVKAVVALALLMSGLVLLSGVSRAGDYKEDKAFLGELSKSKHTLAQGIEQATTDKAAVISAKFEFNDKGELSLSVYVAEKGVATDAEHNVLKELSGSPESTKWSPETEVFKDVEHVSRSSTQLTLMSLSKVTLLEIAKKAEKNGTLIAIAPSVDNGEAEIGTWVLIDGKVVEQDYDLTGKLR